MSEPSDLIGMLFDKITLESRLLMNGMEIKLVHPMETHPDMSAWELYMADLSTQWIIVSDIRYVYDDTPHVAFDGLYRDGMVGHFKVPRSLEWYVKVSSITKQTHPRLVAGVDYKKSQETRQKVFRLVYDGLVNQDLKTHRGEAVAMTLDAGIITHEIMKLMEGM